MIFWINIANAAWNIFLFRVGDVSVLSMLNLSVAIASIGFAVINLRQEGAV